MAKKPMEAAQASEPSMALTTAPEKSNLPATASSGFDDFAGAGLENVSSADVLIPRLAILQPLSPQVDERDGAYVQGAKPGMICDVGTGEIFPDGILFVPVYFTKTWLEWAPRKTGKGLIGVHTDPAILDATEDQERGPPLLPNGNLIVETHSFYGLNLTADGRRCFVPFTSTQIKKAKRLNTLATGEKLKRGDGSTFTPPLFYRSYHFTTVQEENAEGKWSGWKVERGAALPELEGFGNWQDVKAEAVSFLESLRKGEVRADVGSMADEGAKPAQASGTDAERM